MQHDMTCRLVSAILLCVLLPCSSLAVQPRAVASYDGKNTAQLRGLERLPGACGVKLFMGSSTGTLLVADDAEIARVLQSGARRVAVHAADEARLVERPGLAGDVGEVAPRPLWRDHRRAPGPGAPR